MIKKGRHGTVDGFELSLSGSSGKIFVRFNQVSSGNDYKVYTASEYPTNGVTWMHVAATFDGAAIRLYVNGVPETSVDAAGLVIAHSDLPLAFGAQDDGVRRFDGALDEVALFDHALSDSEIQALMDGVHAGPDSDGDGSLDDSDALPGDPTESADGDGTGDNADPDDDNDGMPDAWELMHGFDPLDPSDASSDADLDGDSNPFEYQLGTNPRNPISGALAASFDFDEGTGPETLDGSGLGNHGVLVNGPRWVLGVTGSALEFTSGSGRVIVPGAASLDIENELSLMLWIRPNSLGTQYILKKARYGSTDGYEISLSSSGSVYIRLNQNSSRNAYKLTSHRQLPDRWQHLDARGGDLRRSDDSPVHRRRSRCHDQRARPGDRAERLPAVDWRPGRRQLAL